MRSLILLAGVIAFVQTAVPARASQLPLLRQQPDSRLSPLDRTVSVDLQRVSLKRAIDQVARQAGLRIAYSGSTVPLDRSVSVRLNDVSVRDALSQLLQGTGAVPVVAESGQILLSRTAPAVPADGVRFEDGSIAGTVRSAGGGPVVGATVSVVGTRFGATTDAQGRFAITGVPAGQHTLRVEMLGFAVSNTTVTVQDNQQTTVTVALEVQAIELERVVAIGYGTTTRRDLTGSVAVLGADELKTKAAPTVTLSSTLQGRAPGVQVTTTSGLPGANVRVRVRGTGSITANAEPLYVVDGLPAEQGTGSSNPQNNPLMSLDPNEIESIQILKDASATAIYGARGANGVVLIQTRRGRRGESRVTVETSYGVQRISKEIDVLNAREFMQLTNEARANAGQSQLFTEAQIAEARTFDYPDMMLRNALQTTQAITYSGGDQRLRFLINGNYTKQEGIEIGSDFQRIGVRLNMDTDVSSRFRLGSSLSMTRVDRNAAAVENGSLGNSANGIQAAMQFAPFQAPKDENGNWVKTSPTTEPVPNPVAGATELRDLNTTSRVLGSVNAQFDILPELRVQTTLGGNFQFDKINYYAPRTILAGGLGGSGFISSTESRDLTSENQLSFRREVGPGDLDLLGGFSVQTFRTESVQGNGSNFPTDATSSFALGTAAQLGVSGSGVSDAAILSYYGRGNYSIADRYLFTFTGRYDGSSRFGANNKWAFFPSAAVAWRISDEPFLRDRNLFSDLKLRLSYGQVGNQAVGAYQSLSSLGVAWYSFGTTEVPALAPGGTMPNPDLRWEQKTELNVGLDAGFFGNRLTFSADAYNATTDDLLLSVTVPSTTGFGNQVRNIGSVRNRGLELSLNTVNVDRPKFSWRTSLSIAGNRNKVADLGEATQIFVSPRTGNFFAPSQTHVVRVGEPLGAIIGYKVLGLWQQGDTCTLTATVQCTPGEFKILDRDTSGVIEAADRVILGHAEPDFYGGINNSFTYGPFSLDAFINFSYGNEIINAGNAYGSLVIMQLNERKTALDRWTPANTGTTVPRANASRPRRLYSTLVEDGSYIRLQAVTLGYELPARLLRGAESARLFLTGQNLWIATDYSGFDPDVNSSGGDARIGGIDIGAYPRTRTWNVGLSITF
jgi:TonB-dependent starch-binding outer membrane protein SusC